MPKIRIHKEEAQDAEVVETEWDLKRLVIGFVVLSLLIIVAAYIFFPYDESLNSRETLGVSSEEKEAPPLPNKDTIENVISDAQDSLSQITADNLTSSEAAIQKIITDLQGLQTKNGAMGAFCKLVCSDKN